MQYIFMWFVLCTMHMIIIAVCAPQRNMLCQECCVTLYVTRWQGGRYLFKLFTNMLKWCNQIEKGNKWMDANNKIALHESLSLFCSVAVNERVILSQMVNKYETNMPYW